MKPSLLAFQNFCIFNLTNRKLISTDIYSTAIIFLIEQPPPQEFCEFIVLFTLKNAAPLGSLNH